MHLALFRGVPSFYTQHLDNSLHPSIYFLRLNLVQGRGVGGRGRGEWLNANVTSGQVEVNLGQLTTVFHYWVTYCTETTASHTHINICGLFRVSN